MRHWDIKPENLLVVTSARLSARACFGLKPYGGIGNNLLEEHSICLKLGIETLPFEVSFFWFSPKKGAIKGRPSDKIQDKFFRRLEN